VADWFPRFGDIPGIDFEPARGINPSRLRGHDVVPEVHVDEFEGKRRERLWWPTKSGGGSASPAIERAFTESRHVSSAALLKRVYEGLELPGEPGDYHFLIQGYANELWGRRRQEPGVLGDVEKLCWLDVRLIEARPDTVMYQSTDGSTFFGVAAFSILINLYQREGSLREALDVAERAARYGQGQEDRDRLAERISAVEREDGG
jgi:hypothetical protein